MTNNEYSWIVVRTFNRHERTLSEFLKQEGIVCFVPMQYTERLSEKEEKSKKVLAPVIHDYVFIKNTLPVDQLENLLSRCRTPLYLLKSKETELPLVISNSEMVEFRMLCDPDFDQQLSIRPSKEDIKVGKEVEIVHGPFTGIRGRLYRKQKRYWFVKTLAGLTVELRITRWYCKPVENKGK